MSMDRRSFIKLTAVTGGATAIAACSTSSPENELIRFVPDEDLTPGIAELKHGVCPICRAGCGTTVRVMQGDAEVVRNGQAGVMTMGLAKKLEGNATHPISQGALCPRGQASIQITYHPDRLREPLKRKGPRGSGNYQPITWEAAIAELLTHLDELASAGKQGSLAALTRPGASSRNDLIALFLEKFGAPAPIAYELFSDDVLRRANLVCLGHEQVPTFDVANARTVISFGADFLGTWNSPVAQMAGYAKMRGGRPGIRGTLIQVEPRMSLTGANADEWVALKPGTEGILALGLAKALGAKDLGEYTPADVEKRTGVSVARLGRLAQILKEQRPAVAIIAGAPLAHVNGLFQASAIDVLNMTLGAVDAPGGVSFTPQLDRTPRASRSLQALAADALAGKGPQALLIDGANPVHSTPPGWKVKDALAKIPYIVSFGQFADDTSVLADLILPDHSALESWTDARPESGTTTSILTVAGPAMKPLHNTRATPDVLLDVAKKLKKPLAGMPESFSAMLTAAAGGDDAWATATKQGWVAIKGASKKSDPAKFRPANAKTQSAEPVFDGDPAQYPFHFLPFASQAFLDGSTAHLPWLQEMPDPISTAMWSTWAEINPQTATRLGIGDGDMIEIASAHGSIHAPALISPGIAPDVIAMPAGQGHETFTRYASGRGSNPVKVLSPAVEPETGALAWASTRVKIARVSEANGELIRYGAALREFEPHR
jgi:anaerobic selenocysteine-containing dehydrogenase